VLEEINFNRSSVTQIVFEGHSFFIKRDDLIDKNFSGNKARKFYYYLKNNFSFIDTLVSYGSSQSNAMYSLSVLAKKKGWKFNYYVEHLPSYLYNNPHGNYLGALNNGMNIFEASPPQIIEKNMLFIEEGGRQEEAKFGIKLLAKEIEVWQEEKNLKSLSIFLPSGTGTTALFLQKYLPNNQVYTTPCVGDKAYLSKQFSLLEKEIKYHPTILTLEKKHHFGKLYRQNYEIWLKLHKQTEIAFDLLYDPLGWRVLLEHKERDKNSAILYIHQGGILGNESMLPRYQRKYKDME